MAEKKTPLTTDARLFNDCTPCSRDATAKQAYLIKRGVLVYGDDRNVGHNSVLREGRCTHLKSTRVNSHWAKNEGTNKVVYGLAIDAEATGVVWHDTFSLGCSDYNVFRKCPCVND